MELHPKYPYIWYKLGLANDVIGYKQKAKEYFSQNGSHKRKEGEDKMIQLMNISMDDNIQVIYFYK